MVWWERYPSGVSNVEDYSVCNNRLERSVHNKDGATIMAGLYDRILDGFGGRYNARTGEVISVLRTALGEYKDGNLTITEVRDQLGIAPGSQDETDLLALQTQIDAGIDDEAKELTISSIQTIMDRVKMGLYTDAKMRTRLGI